ncbi:MAG: hypothetical protein V1806_17395 [Pseudomonadota bacterium]
METREFRYGLKVRVVNPSPERAHTKGWEGTLGQSSRGPRKRGVRASGSWGDWWHVQFIGGSGLYPKHELELI